MATFSADRHVREEADALEHVAHVPPQRDLGVVAQVPAIELMAPEVGSMRRLISRRIVVLPEPDEPRSTNVSPCSMVSETSRRAKDFPPSNDLLT